MEEQGLVIQQKDRTVIIKAQRSTACDGCSSKKSCHSGGGSDTDTFIEAENPIGAKVGDRVVFSIGAASVIKAGLLIYLVPILSFIAGVVLGQIAAKNVFPGQNPDLVAGLLGLAFLILAFIGLKLYNKYLEKNKGFRPQVLRVV